MYENRKNRQRLAVFGIVGATAILWASSAYAQTDGLFSPAPRGSVLADQRWPQNAIVELDGKSGLSLDELPKQIVQLTGARTLRRRSALMDFDALAAARAHAERGENARATLYLNLFDDARFKAVSLHAAPSFAGYTLSGAHEGVPLGTVSLAVSGVVVAGEVLADVTTDLAGVMVYANKFDESRVTVQVVEDHVHLTGRLDDDPEQVVQMIVPWRELANMLPPS